MAARPLYPGRAPIVNAARSSSNEDRLTAFSRVTAGFDQITVVHHDLHAIDVPLDQAEIGARPPLLRKACERYARAMQQSERQILTTHAGRLPRPPELVDMYVRLSRPTPVDAVELDSAAA